MERRVEICAIASGSNGNCYYIGNGKSAILIDAGISAKQTILRMKEKEIDPAGIKAIFITHEHSDHIKGARVLEKRLNIPVYITFRTYNAVYKNQKPINPKFFLPGETIKIDEFSIHSFLKNHDAVEPCSFRIEYEGRNIGVCTDIGEPCENVTAHISKCDALFLESNYDEEMLHNGPYPEFLKQRVRSEIGHLSNMQAVGLVENHASEKLKCIFLSHISKENNNPDLAVKAMQPVSDKIEIFLTSRINASAIYNL